MLTFGFVIEVEGLLAETESKRAVDRICKQIHEEIGEYWHEHCLPRHFERAAASRYDYTPRSPKTREIRERQHRAGIAAEVGVALVRSGATRTRAHRMALVKGWPTRGEITFFVPHYILRKRANRPNLAEEIKSLSVDEQEEIRAFAERRLLELVRQAKARRQRDSHGRFLAS